MPKSKARILVVDDEQMVRQALCRAFARDEHEIVEASSGREALDVLRGQEVDLIFSDCVMPEMDGPAFLKEAAKIRPEAFRILVVGHADLDLAVAAINSGAIYRFLLKPWDSYDLRVMVQLALRHREAQRANAASRN